jgi:hypothetical protein
MRGILGRRLVSILAAYGGLLSAQGVKTNTPGVVEAFTELRDCSSCRANIRIDSTLVQVSISVTDLRGGFVQDLPVRSRNSSNTVIPRGIWTEFAITLGGFAEYRDPQPQTRTEVA